MKKLWLLIMLLNCYSCQLVLLSYSANNPHYPKKIHQTKDTYILTPNESYNSTGVIMIKDEFSLPFRINFEFSIWDNEQKLHAPYTLNDGFCVMFCKKGMDYGSPPLGHYRGFKYDETGYGIHFLSNSEHPTLLLMNSRQQCLVNRNMNLDYRDGEWHKVNLDVDKHGISMRFDGKLLLKWHGFINDNYKNIGFGAANKDTDSEHRVRNIEVIRM